MRSWRRCTRVVDDSEGTDGDLRARGALVLPRRARAQRGRPSAWTGGHYLASAVYAYAFLFPGTATDVPNRSIRACASPPISTTAASRSGSDRRRQDVELGGGTYALPFGKLEIGVRSGEAPLGRSPARPFLAGRRARGVRARRALPAARARRAARGRDGPLEPEQEPEDFVDPATRVPVTAIVRIADAAAAARRARAPRHARARRRARHRDGAGRRSRRPARGRADGRARLHAGGAEVLGPGAEGFLGGAIAGKEPTRLDGGPAVPARADPGRARPRHRRRARAAGRTW